MTYATPIRLIISADDLGVSEARNRGMKKCGLCTKLIDECSDLINFFTFRT